MKRATAPGDQHTRHTALQLCRNYRFLTSGLSRYYERTWHWDSAAFVARVDTLAQALMTTP